MILLARTTALADVKKKSKGMSVFIVNLKEAMAHRSLRMSHRGGAMA